MSSLEDPAEKPTEKSRPVRSGPHDVITVLLDDGFRISGLESASEGRNSHRKRSGTEIRHVAGIDAGSRLSLINGTYLIKTDPEAEPIEIEIEGSTAVAKPRNIELMLDGLPIHSEEIVGNKVLSAMGNSFTIRNERNQSGKSAKPSRRKKRKNIQVPKFRLKEKVTWIHGDTDETPSQDLDEESAEFIESIEQARNLDAATQRTLHPDPEELAQRVDTKGAEILSRGASDPNFLRWSISYADLPWRPNFGLSREIPRNLHANVDQLCSIPSVPITANLARGPLAIIGPPEARFASARHAICSLVAFQKVGSLDLKVITTPENSDSHWGWTSEFPSWASQADNQIRVVIVDGIRAFDLAGLHHDKVTSGEMHMIILAEDESELPDYFDIKLAVTNDGRATATNQAGEQLEGIALGVGTRHATKLMQRLNQIGSS